MPSVTATECYAPSEVSIDWSVTTAEGFDKASVSNFSVSASEIGGAALFRRPIQEEGGGKKKGSGGGGLLLMSCRDGKDGGRPPVGLRREGELDFLPCPPPPNPRSPPLQPSPAAAGHRFALPSGMVSFGGAEESSSGHAASKKRFRTKFGHDQKDRMREFGWGGG